MSSDDESATRLQDGDGTATDGASKEVLGNIDPNTRRSTSKSAAEEEQTTHDSTDGDDGDGDGDGGDGEERSAARDAEEADQSKSKKSKKKKSKKKSSKPEPSTFDDIEGADDASVRVSSNAHCCQTAVFRDRALCCLCRVRSLCASAQQPLTILLCCSSWMFFP